MQCPRCSSEALVPNCDNDPECYACGHVVYDGEALPISNAVERSLNMIDGVDLDRRNRLWVTVQAAKNQARVNGPLGDPMHIEGDWP